MVKKSFNLLGNLFFSLRTKFIGIFSLLELLPLALLIFLIFNQIRALNDNLELQITKLSRHTLEYIEDARRIGEDVVENALNLKLTDEFERMSIAIANDIADFLYLCDADIRFLANIKPDEGMYKKFIESKTGIIEKQKEYRLSDDGKNYTIIDNGKSLNEITSSFQETSQFFNSKNIDNSNKELRPLYLEATFIDLSGMEKIKVTNSNLLKSIKRNVSFKENTFIGAEQYFNELKKLKPGEIYISDVVGKYIGSKFTGIYTQENLAFANLPFEPEKEAYVEGKNPFGQRFKGIIRFATPYVENGQIVGFITLALDHDHIINFIERCNLVTDQSDVSGDNYISLWDNVGRNIAHPAHYAIVGFDIESGKPQLPLLDEALYRQMQESGLDFGDFMKQAPIFYEQSISKRPAEALIINGFLGNDCRYMNFMPQCTGFFDLTRNGGAGSFRIFFENIWHLNAVSTIPYYTGRFATSPRGFGFVVINVNLFDSKKFISSVNSTFSKLRDDLEADIDGIEKQTKAFMKSRLNTSIIQLGVGTVILSIFIIFGVFWVTSIFLNRISLVIYGLEKFKNGERDYRYKVSGHDEISILFKGLNNVAEIIESNALGPVTIVDENEKIIYMNENALVLVGRKLDDVKGRAYSRCTIYPQGTMNPLECFKQGTTARPHKCLKDGRFYQGIVKKVDLVDGKQGYMISSIDVSPSIQEQNRSERFKQELESEHALMGWMQRLSQSENMSFALNEILEGICKYYNADRAYIYDFDCRLGENNDQGFIEWHIVDVDPVPKDLHKLSGNIIKIGFELIDQHGELFIGSPEEIQEKYPSLYELFMSRNIRKLLGVPLYSAGNISGVICITNPRRNSGNLTLLHSLAHFTGSEFSKRATVEMLKDIGLKDGLTNLGNRNAYLREVLRLKSSTSCLGVIFIDLNNLKFVNDTFGHEYGDIYISLVSKKFLDYFRSRDIFRIGGDEFVFLCEGMEESLFSKKLGDMLGHIHKEIPGSISAGYIWEKSSSNVEQMIRIADQNMYESKEHLRKVNGTDLISKFFTAYIKQHKED